MTKQGPDDHNVVPGATVDLGTTRLEKNRARKLLSEVLAKGSVGFSKHASEELAKDNMTTVDAANVLRCGRITEEGEERNGTIRYRVRTDRMCVVFAFRSPLEGTVVSAWREKGAKR